MSSEGQGPSPGRGPEPRPEQPSGGPPPPQEDPAPQGPPPQGPPPWAPPPPGPPPPPWGPPGYPPPYGSQPPPPYGYAPLPPYQPGPRTQTDGTAITALVLAIASFVLIPTVILAPVCPVLAIVSLSLCPSSRRRIQASGGAITGEGLLTAAKIVAWINVGLAALVLLLIGIGAAAGWWSDDDYDYSLRLALGYLA